MKFYLPFYFVLILLLICYQSEAQNKTVTNGETIETITLPGTLCTYNWTNDKPEIGLATTGTGSIPSFTAKNATNSPIVATITATPAISGMAYIANNYINTVSVIDLATNKVVTTLSVGNTPVGVAVNPVNNQVYITNTFESSVSVINTLTNTVKATVKVGSYPYSVYVSPDGMRAYVPNYNDSNISVINTATNAVIGTWAAGINPFFVTGNGDGSLLYVNNHDNDNYGPGTVTVINTKTGAIVSTITVGSQPWDIITSPNGKLVYVTNSNSAGISVISTSSNAVVGNIPGQLPIRDIAISHDGSLLYVRQGYTNNLYVINTSTYAIVASIPLTGTEYAGMCVSPDGKRLLLVNQGTSTVTVIDTKTNAIVAEVSVPGNEPVSPGNFIIGGNNCEPVTFTITVNPSPAISTSGSLSALATIYGTPSSTTFFSVSGTWLTSALTVTAPIGFELSTDNINFSKTLTINNNSGSINAVRVYVRLSSITAVGTYSGNMVISGSNMADINIPIPASHVQPAPLTVKADDKSKFYGSPNPVLTATYTGFVNNESISQLTALPSIFTLAATSSPIGKYPIIVSNAAAANYTFTYINGLLDITENTSIIHIPNTFTPNGDGVNDKWEIRNLNTFMASTVSVFNRNGQQVFFTRGYTTPWDGRYNNKDLPVGVYYYLIKTDAQAQTLAGYVMISR
jgi:gliding motility-associated-like protein